MRTHIETLLCTHLFHQQDLRDPEFGSYVLQGLAVDEILPELDVLPQRLHLAERQRVVLVADADDGELVSDLTLPRL